MFKTTITSQTSGFTTILVNGNPVGNLISQLNMSNYIITNNNINITLNNNSVALITNDISLNYYTNLQGGSNAPIGSIVPYGDSIYVSGVFTTIGNVAATYLAKWDGTNWSSLNYNGSPPSSTVFNNLGVLYVTRTIVQSGPVLSKFTGTTWSTVIGDGEYIIVDGRRFLLNGISTMAFDSNNVMYLSCSLFERNTNGLPNILLEGQFAVLTYNESSNTFNFVGDGAFNGSGPNILIFDNYGELYVSGAFNEIINIDNGSITSLICIAKLDSYANLWVGLSNYPNSFARVIKFDSNNQMYVGGTFTSVSNGTVLNYIAILDFETEVWTPLANGLDAEVGSIYIDNTNNLYVGGAFNLTIGSNVRLNKIGMWNNSNLTWSSLGGGVPENGAAIGSIYLLNNNVYAAGRFEVAGNVVCKNIFEIVKGDVDSYSVNLSVNNKFLRTMEGGQTVYTVVSNNNKVYNLGLASEAL
jgi:hypothetical protein